MPETVVRNVLVTQVGRKTFVLSCVMSIECHVSCWQGSTSGRNSNMRQTDHTHHRTGRAVGLLVLGAVHINIDAPN